MTLFCENEKNCEAAKEELQSRHVSELSLWDVVLDFILLDAFDDIKVHFTVYVSILHSVSILEPAICNIFSDKEQVAV